VLVHAITPTKDAGPWLPEGNLAAEGVGDDCILGRPRDERRRAELRAGACEYLLRVGVGAAEVVLDQLLGPLMAQFETYRSERT
jgi:hypothetical protein